MIDELLAYAPLDGHEPVSLDVTHWLQTSELDAKISNVASTLREKADLFLTKTSVYLKLKFASDPYLLHRHYASVLREIAQSCQGTAFSSDGSGVVRNRLAKFVFVGALYSSSSSRPLLGQPSKALICLYRYLNGEKAVSPHRANFSLDARTLCSLNRWFDSREEYTSYN